MPKAKDYKEYYIYSLADFLKRIREFKSNHRKVLWFRGHSGGRFVLQPSIYRKPFDSQNESFLMDRFKSRAIPFLHRLPESNSQNSNGYWEWLYLMQHFKLPTRLLDWTESALIALAFAVIFRDHERTGIRNTGAHVWCIDPIVLNKNFKNISGIPNINESQEAQELFEKGWPTPEPAALPLAIYGPQNNPRIVGQKGVFTIFPSRTGFIFDNTMPKDIGLKLIIKSDANVKKIAKELFLIGISESIVFPELDSVSLEIKREYENYFS